MTKLRIILSYNFFFLFLIVIVLLRIGFNQERKSKYNETDNIFNCKVLNIYTSTDYKYDLMCKEKIIGYSKELYDIGDILRIKGNLKEISKQTNYNLFDYKEYYNRQGIFYRLFMEEVVRVGKSLEINLILKKAIYDRIENLESFPYLNSLILGNKGSLDEDIKDLYTNMGIIHIFSVSGMHLSFLIVIFEKLLKNNQRKSILLVFVLFIYYQIIGSVSILRSIIYFLLKLINDKLSLNISKVKLLLIMLFLILMINPNNINNIGFYYSVIVSSSIILFSSKIKKKNQYLLIPLLCFFVTIPLNLYLYSSVNLSSFLFNIIIVPIFSLIIYPMTILTIIFPFLDYIYIILTKILENLSIYLNTFSLEIILIKPSIFLIVIYYVLMFLVYRKYKNIKYLLLLLVFHYNFNHVFPSSFLLAIDVGNGDSFLIYHKGYSILIDTGGNNYEIAKNITIPIIKSFGIRKIDLMIITHGDEDHAKEVINIVNEIKVGKVYLNSNKENELEKQIISLLNAKKIKYKKVEKVIERNSNMFLLSKSYSEEHENNSSIINYLVINNVKILLTGDINKEIEEKFIRENNIKEIDILKIAHHGSNTSSSDKFISKINPKTCLISVGKNNIYNHPSSKVLERIKDCNTYRTDLDGSIKINFIKDKYIIEKKIDKE